ncbi:unnamed protein product [Pleuronectes platessa]|uniref:Uncharacterized protein n=1 Tax=Pleuronectes platessa TaxID=8262 RepID=A0A9N7TSA1_PLEPL|nr:unnamed protein product [Pleuronectes platessa]
MFSLFMLISASCTRYELGVWEPQTQPRRVSGERQTEREVKLFVEVSARSGFNLRLHEIVDEEKREKGQKQRDVPANWMFILSLVFSGVSSYLDDNRTIW